MSKKRPTRAEQVNDLCNKFAALGTLVVDIGCFAASFFQYQAALRGACRMRDLYRRERERADDAERACAELRAELRAAEGLALSLWRKVPPGSAPRWADDVAAIRRRRGWGVG